MASTYTVGSILDSVEKKIQDEANADWSVSDILDSYNQTLREIVKLVPRAYTVIETFLMVSGAKQALPSDGLVFMGIISNMGTDGATPGKSPRITAEQILSTYYPDWREETAVQEISNYFLVENNPREFYVYPQSDGTGYIQCKFSKTPPTTTYDANDNYRAETLPLSDEYLDAVINGILYKVYDDDSDIPGNTPRSSVFYARFRLALGLGGPQ